MTHGFALSFSGEDTFTLDVSFDPHPENFKDTFVIDDVSIPPSFYYIRSDESLIELTKHWNQENTV